MQAQEGNTQQAEARTNTAAGTMTPDADDDGETLFYPPRAERDSAAESEDPEYGLPLFTRSRPELKDNVTTVG